MMFFHDLRYAIRAVWKAPVFAGAAILTLALGIGANAAIFSVFNAVLLRPLPFPTPERLIRIYEKNDKLNLPQFASSVLNYLSWKEQTQTFEELGFIAGATFNLSGSGEPEQFAGNAVSTSLPRVLGLKPVAGRFFRDDEEKPGGARVAVIGEGLWKRRFGGDPALIGRTFILNGAPYTVAGIGPAAMSFLTQSEIWIPYVIDPAREARLNHVTAAIGRLKPGVPIEQAQAEMDTIARRVGMQFPGNKDWGVRLQTFERWIVADRLRTALTILLAAVGFVLLIACANVANLLLSRAAARQKEIAIRAALGAGRGRLIRQLLTESLLLSVTGGAAGLAAAAGAIRAMSASIPASLLPVSEIAMDSHVLIFALGLAIASGVLFGLAPAWQSARTDLNDVLKQGGRSSSGSARPYLRKMLIGGALALATVLLVGAGLLLESLFHLQGVRVGFRTDRLLTFQVSPAGPKYAGVAQSWPFYERLIESIRGIPGVRDAAISSGIPFGAGSYNTTPAQPVGPAALPVGESIPVDWRIVSPGYFRAMEIPLVRGREFTAQDNAAQPLVMIVSRNTAQKFWGDIDPVGRVVRFTSSGREARVVGVAGDVLNTSLGQPVAPAMYFSAVSRLLSPMDVAVRTQGDPLVALDSVRRKLKDLDAELPMSNVRSTDDWLSRNSAQPRLNAVLLELFAAVALLIASIGIYGVLSYSVTQQTREIGVRAALGANRSELLRLVLREGLTMALAGIGAGLIAGLGLSRLLASLLFGVAAHDPLTFAAVAGILAVVAAAACAIPALRAARIDPAIALRCE
jgi:putative ABC transport system permease protein